MTPETAKLIEIAVNEDLGDGDLTSSLIPDRDSCFTFRSREEGVLAGTEVLDPILRTIAERMGKEMPALNLELSDGDMLKPDMNIGTVEGNVKVIFAAERLMLNFLTHLSGVATTTHRLAQLVAGSRTAIRDTRKTLPGLRELEKHAVAMGGGTNHRLGLYDAILIKDNHLAVASMPELVQRARQLYPSVPIEVEVDSLHQLEEALELQVELILLDNFSLQDVAAAVQVAGGKTKLEISGGVRPEDLPGLARLGVDYIAMGSLTHSAKALDIGLDQLSSDVNN